MLSLRLCDRHGFPVIFNVTSLLDLRALGAMERANPPGLGKIVHSNPYRLNRVVVVLLASHT